MCSHCGQKVYSQSFSVTVEGVFIPYISREYVVAVSVLELYFSVELFQKSNIGVDVVNFFGNEGDCLLFDELEDVGVLVPDDLFDLLMFVWFEDDHLELHPRLQFCIHF